MAYKNACDTKYSKRKTRRRQHSPPQCNSLPPPPPPPPPQACPVLLPTDIRFELTFSAETSNGGANWSASINTHTLNHLEWNGLGFAQIHYDTGPTDVVIIHVRFSCDHDCLASWYVDWQSFGSGDGGHGGEFFRYVGGLPFTLAVPATTLVNDGGSIFSDVAAYGHT